MESKRIVKIIALLLLFSVVLRFCFIIVNAKHDCTHDDNCPICTLIHRFQDDLDGFDPNLSKVIIAVILLIPPVEFYIANRLTDKKRYTLVGLKVELIN